MATCDASERLASDQTAPWVAKVLPLHNETAVELVIVRLDVGLSETAAAAALLSGEERQRARRFAFERERCRFVVARAKLRQLLGAQLGIQPEAVELVYGKHGKPALAPRFAPHSVHFNLSHSDDLAVFAFAAGCRVGVDIERIRPLDSADHIATQFFSPSERDAYRALAPADKTLGFFNAWTRKEAFIKALGDGLYHPLDAFDVSLAPGQAARLGRVGSADGAACGWTLHSFRPAPGLVGAVVVEAAANGSGRCPPARVH